MVRGQRSIRSIRSAGLVALLVVVGPLLGAQVITRVSEQHLAVGERLTYSLIIDHEEPRDVEVEAPQLPGFRVIAGPTVRPVGQVFGTDRTVQIEVLFTLEAVAAGRYVLPSQPVSVAGQLYQTEERLVSVGTARNRNQVPFLAAWRGPEGPLMVGQSAVYTLEMFNLDTYTYPSSVTLAAPESAILEEVQGLGAIAERSVDGVTLYAIPVAVFVVTATAAGTLRLPAATIAAEGMEVRAAPLEARVEPLPAPAEASGAVGRFAFTAGLEPSSLITGDRTRLVLRVSGAGNLHFLAMPEVRLEGLRIESDTRDSRLDPGRDGYVGYVERRLVLRPAEEGPYRIDVDPFVYVDPVDRRISRVAATVPPIVVAPSRRAQLPDDAGAPLIGLLSRDELIGLERRVWYDSVVSYGWMAPGALFFVVSKFWKRTRGSGLVAMMLLGVFLIGAAGDHLPMNQIDRAYRRYEEGAVTLALYAFEDAARLLPDSPGIQHNLSVLHFELGDVPRSVYAAREAIRLAPGVARLRRTLEFVEGLAGLDRSTPVPHMVHPDVHFAILALAVNLLFLAGAAAPWTRSSRRGGGAVLIGALVLSLVVVVTGAGLVVTALGHDDQLGVVRVATELRRIPGADADGWLPVAAGTALSVITVRDGSVLVRTALDLEGWLPIEELLWSGSPAVNLFRYRGFVTRPDPRVFT